MQTALYWNQNWTGFELSLWNVEISTTFNISWYLLGLGGVRGS
jgi:hypothetical protein